MKSISVALSTHFGGVLTSICTCWKVTRTDGEVFGFTDHDADLTIDGISYEASTGFYRTAIANSATTSVDNLEVRGFLDSSSITETELRNGAFDFAAVEVFAVNWRDLSMGICRLRYGFFGEVTIRPSGIFVVELRGLMQLLSQTVGETIQPECRADLGDERCKVALIPSVRESGQTYAAGDRVLVPVSGTLTAVYLPIENNDFEWYDSTIVSPSAHNLVSGTPGWKLTGCLLTNYPLVARTGTYYIKPNAASGNIYRAVSVAFGATTRDINFSYWVKHNEAGWEDSALIEVKRSNGTIITQSSTAYSSATVGVWTQRTLTIAGADMTNASSVWIRARFQSGTGSTEAAKVQIDDFALDFSGTPYTSGMDFDDGTSTTINTPAWDDGADGSNGQSHPGNANLLPYSGTRMMRPNQGSFNTPTAQTISLVGIGLLNTELDAGNYILDLGFYTAAFEWGQQYSVDVDFLNASNALISTASTGWVDVAPADEWQLGKLIADIPSLTRSVKLKLNGRFSPNRPLGAGLVICLNAFDSIFGSIVHKSANGMSFIDQFGGVEYEATTGGTTSTTVPTFTHTLGEDVTDGSVVWEAVKPQYTFYAEIGTVTSNTVFTLPDVDAPDDWFNWGVLKFLTGLNSGRGIEVLDWNNTTKTITIMLPALMTISPGDTIMVHAGCDKTRGAGGCGKFSNILNFRGEPDVPGTDEYFKVGGTGR